VLRVIEERRVEVDNTRSKIIEPTIIVISIIMIITAILLIINVNLKHRIAVDTINQFYEKGGLPVYSENANMTFSFYCDMDN
jgi:hypothetical protein